ncbi:acetyltransferase [Mycobacterium sp. E3251]|uniref:GNAT family N-acetyltransferase n=1 Tax=unclassified Mycobacterium TaxID=2642494 RepID=UPI0007FC9C68|nr:MULTISPECIES: GNAT family N-acetyltransferase [unclassified Mycobacterium]OBG95850.1 acetyltransferase [Mycobacterium sp. E3251]OBI24681.1 acetyltransferase [Mycobacterium sp. E2238]OBI39142.1 acetyltransferase [Mycobacterium sp. E1386]
MTQVRAAVPADAYEVACLHVRSWQSAYRGLIGRAYLDNLTPEALVDRYTFGRVGLRMPSTLVAVEGSAIRGFATTGLCRENDLPNFGELMALYVDPDHLGAGVGRSLMVAARERLRRVGARGAVLWALEGNTRALSFYGRDGWRPDGSCRAADFGTDTRRLVRYRIEPV